MNLKNRVKKNNEFKEIMDAKDLFRLKSCTIFFKETASTYKFGISVSKKIGNAVIRNLTKRRIRACIKNIDDSNFNKNYDFIVIAKQPIVQMSYNDIENEIKKALLSRFIGD